MCGLFGFIGQGPADAAILRHCALAARRRGPDSIGGWLGGPCLGGDRLVGAGSDQDRVLEWIISAAVDRQVPWLIGHCRLAPEPWSCDRRNAQPLTFDFGVLAHNGNISSHRAIAKSRNLHLATEVDSEVVGRLIESGSFKRIEDAFGHVDSGAPAAWLAICRGDFLAYRRRHPLGILKRPEGCYLASDPRFGQQLPAEAWLTFASPGASVDGKAPC